MADTRQQIVDAIKTGLETISIANGYLTEIGAGVKKWRPFKEGNPCPFQISELPAVTFSDHHRTTLPMSSGLQDHRHEIDVEFNAWATADANVDDVIRLIAGDINKMIGANIRWPVNAVYLADNTLPVEDFTIVQQAEKIIGGHILRIKVSYRTQRWQTS